MPTERNDFLGLRFDPLSKDQVLERLSQVTYDTPYSYVVTPNVDHMVRLHESQESADSFKPMYAAAGLCLCDSRILQLLARLRGVDLPVVPGSGTALPSYMGAVGSETIGSVAGRRL